MTDFLSRIITILILLASFVVRAEDSAPKSLLNINGSDTETDALAAVSFDTRIDFQHLWHDGATDTEDSGFKGKYFMLRAEGSIMDGLVDYSWRQRLNRRKENSSAFDDTDWVWVRGNFNGWHLSAGKEVVLVGGWEYDYNPIDVYTHSLFWDNMPSYTFAVTLSRDFGFNDSLALQFAQSPWHTPINNNMYAYNLMWTGRHGIFSALWTVNLLEYRPGHYINYIALGNRLELGPVRLDFDVVNRAATGQAFLMADYSLMTELSWKPSQRWRLHLKYTFDDNHSGTEADYTVADGTHLNMLGCGAEFNLLERRAHNLRLHANCFYSWGVNTNANDPMQRRTAIAALGFRWHVNLLTVKTK